MIVSFHQFFTPTGQKIDYARIQCKIGTLWIGQSVLLCRLPAELQPSKYQPLI